MFNWVRCRCEVSSGSNNESVLSFCQEISRLVTNSQLLAPKVRPINYFIQRLPKAPQIENALTD